MKILILGLGVSVTVCIILQNANTLTVAAELQLRPLFGMVVKGHIIFLIDWLFAYKMKIRIPIYNSQTQIWHILFAL